MTLDRRTVFLGIVAAGAVAAAATATVINHRSGGSHERNAVSAYIERVNAIQNQMHAPLTRVLLAYRDFTQKGGPKPRAAHELAAAARTLTTLDRRLAALPSPPEAAKLRRLLVSLVDRQASITREVQGIAEFSPRFARVLVSARTANARLGAALKQISVPQPHKLRGTKAQVLAAQRKYQDAARQAAIAQADAVDAYDASVMQTVKRLRRLSPPPAFVPTYRAQIHALTDVAGAGERLSAELRKSDRSRVPALGRQFTLASREAQTVGAQRAEIAAIRGYNARAKALNAASARVQAELTRLQTSLP